MQADLFHKLEALGIEKTEEQEQEEMYIRATPLGELWGKVFFQEK